MTKRVLPLAVIVMAFAFSACSHVTETIAPVTSNTPAASSTSNSAGSNAAGAATIIRKDPRFDKLVPADAKVEKLVDGYSWVEGPVWNRKESYLLFSNIPKNEII